MDETGTTLATGLAGFPLVLAWNVGAGGAAESVLLEPAATGIAVWSPIFRIPPQWGLFRLAGSTGLGLLSNARFWAHKLKGLFVLATGREGVGGGGWLGSPLADALFKLVRGVRGRKARQGRTFIQFVISVWGVFIKPSSGGGWYGIYA